LDFLKPELPKIRSYFNIKTGKKKSRDVGLELRNFVYDSYVRFVDSFDWNKDAKIPLVPAIQLVNDEAEALDIAETGFQLSSTNQAMFGQGLYFTTDCLNIFHSEKKDASSPSQSFLMIISLTIPGNVYPVIEQHSNDSVSLMGNPIVAGYNSHYVLTTKEGRAIELKEEASAMNELIVSQESQVLPAFIVSINIP